MFGVIFLRDLHRKKQKQMTSIYYRKRIQIK